MRYKVEYLKPKKKSFVREEVTFFDIESAIFWEQKMTEQGATDFKIIPS